MGEYIFKPHSQPIISIRIIGYLYIVVYIELVFFVLWIMMVGVPNYYFSMFSGPPSQGLSSLNYFSCYFSDWCQFLCVQWRSEIFFRISRQVQYCGR